MRERISKPKAAIRITTADWTVEVLCIVALILTTGLALTTYNELPSIIPRHYAGTGEPDGYGIKSILFVPLATSIALYVLLTAALKYPHLFNYPVRITASNVDRQYRNLYTMTRVLKVIIVLVGFYLTFGTIQIARGIMHGLGTWFLTVTLLSIVVTVVGFIYRAFRLT